MADEQTSPIVKRAAHRQRKKVLTEDLDVESQLIIPGSPQKTRRMSKNSQNKVAKDGEKKIEEVKSQVRGEDGKVKCDECGKDLERKYLAFHKHAVHSEDAYAYKCKETGCDERYSDLSELSDHRRVAHGFPKKMCKVEGCGSAFLLYSEYVSHSSVTHQMKAECDECGKMLSPSYIADHKSRMHNREKLVKCRMIGCDTKFREKSHLKDHLRLVHGFARLHCNVVSCKAEFFSVEGLSQHIKCHLK